MAESRKCCKCGRPAPIRWEGTGWIGSLLIDELMCPDCQRPQTHPHITHFDDCGCLSARKDGEIADLHARVSRLEQQLEHAGELLTEEQVYHLETQTALVKAQAERDGLREALERVAERNVIENPSTGKELFKLTRFQCAQIARSVLGPR